MCFKSTSPSVTADATESWTPFHSRWSARSICLFLLHLRNIITAVCGRICVSSTSFNASSFSHAHAPFSSAATFAFHHISQVVFVCFLCTPQNTSLLYWLAVWGLRMQSNQSLYNVMGSFWPPYVFVFCCYNWLVNKNNKGDANNDKRFPGLVTVCQPKEWILNSHSLFLYKNNNITFSLPLIEFVVHMYHQVDLEKIEKIMLFWLLLYIYIFSKLT